MAKKTFNFNLDDDTVGDIDLNEKKIRIDAPSRPSASAK